MRISDWSSDVCSSDLPDPLQCFVKACSGRQTKPHFTLGRIDRQAERTGAGVPPNPQRIGDAGNDHAVPQIDALKARSEEHTSELQSLMRISYAVFCLKKKKT